MGSRAYEKILEKEEEEQIKKRYPHPDRYVSAEHFSDLYIKNFISKRIDGIHKCDYGGRDYGVSIKSVVDFIFNRVCKYYEPAMLYDGPSCGWLDEDDGNNFPYEEFAGVLVKKGEDAIDIETMLCGAGICLSNKKLLNDIIARFQYCLQWESSCKEWVSVYAFYDREDDEYKGYWEYLVYKAESTNLDFLALKQDEDVKRLMDCVVRAVKKSNLINPSYTCEHIYRSRGLMTNEEATKFEDITSAPNNRCKAGRMNIEGESNFYGSFKQDISVLESRAKDKYAIGDFKTKTCLRILDLSKLKEEKSLFAEGNIYINNFLCEFSKAISKSNFEQNERKYLPTQIFASAIKETILESGYNPINNEKVETGIDGIIYMSSFSKKYDNIVLFFDHENSKYFLKLNSIETRYLNQENK